MAKKKKAKDTIPIKIEVTEPNRYGAQGIYNETGVHCCCHMVPLTDICDGCEALRETKRQPTLVGVDAVRMNPLNDDGGRDNDPAAILEDLGNAVEDEPPEGGGSIRG